MRLILLCVCVCSIAGMYSCGKEDIDKSANSLSQDSTIVSYLDTMDVSYTRDTSGIYAYTITSNPSGKSQSEGTILSVYYNLKVLGGQTLEQIDPTESDPVRMKRGVNAIYPVGVDLALAKMKEGEKWGFVIPSQWAYRDYSSSLIPKNAIIVIEITLDRIQNDNDIRSEDNQKVVLYSNEQNLSDTLQYPLNQPEILTNGMIYKRLKAGDTEQSPTTGSEVKITYTLSTPGVTDPIDVQYAGEANPFTFQYNALEVFEGLNFGVGLMRKGEEALFVIPSLLGYRESVSVLPSYLSEELVQMELIPGYASKVVPYKILVVKAKLVDIQ